MKKTLLFTVLVFLGNTLFAQRITTLTTKNPSKEAVALFSYLNDIYGKKTLAGQMDAKWGVDELAYVKENTGKLPAIRGMDYMDPAENNTETQHAIEWWRKGGIPTIMWHWGAPGIGYGYENTKKEIDINKCFEKGTVEYNAMWAELKSKADQLEKLRDAHVPVLWRPFHELNGNWFWWGKQGPDQFKRLWINMYNYFVNERKLNNLIWVLCYTGKPDAAWYPGDQYVDIAGADTYNAGNGPQPEMYQKVKDITGDKKMITYHECGIPPDPKQCAEQKVMWLWWMEWHTNFITGVDKNYLKQVYNDDLVITLDEVPDIMKVYGKK